MTFRDILIITHPGRIEPGLEPIDAESLIILGVNQNTIILKYQNSLDVMLRVGLADEQKLSASKVFGIISNNFKGKTFKEFLDSNIEGY